MSEKSDGKSKGVSPGTTSPATVINRIDKRLKNVGKVGKNDEEDPNKKTGSKFGKRKNARKNPLLGIGPHRKKYSKNDENGENKKDKKDKEENKKLTKEDSNMTMIDAILFLIENHKRGSHVLQSFPDQDMLTLTAKKCMSTCLKGWQIADEGLISENTDLILSKESWVILEDGSAALQDGFQFDYDWLYSVANSTLITESSIPNSEIDTDMFADTLTNASSILRKLSDKEVKKYILNAARDEDTDIMNLKEILEETGINWKFTGAEIEDEKINLIINVRYSKDGTQEGVIQKKLSIEVKPSADVTERDSTTKEPNELDLSFNRKPEGEKTIEGEDL
jgi:hypothetical protein